MSSKTGASKDEHDRSLLRTGSDEVHDQGNRGDCQSQALSSAIRASIDWRNTYRERKPGSPVWPPTDFSTHHRHLVTYLFNNIVTVGSNRTRNNIKKFCFASFRHPNIKLLNKLEITIDNITSYDELERILKNQSKTGAQVVMNIYWLGKKRGLTDAEKRSYNCPKNEDTDENWRNYKKGKFNLHAHPRVEREEIQQQMVAPEYMQNAHDIETTSLPIGRKYWLPSQNDREYYADHVLRQGVKCMKYKGHRMFVSDFNFDKNPQQAYSPWIEVKNSWGEHTGDKGYYKFSVDFIKTFFTVDFSTFHSPHSYYTQEYPILKQLAKCGKRCQGKYGRHGHKGYNYDPDTGLGAGLAVDFLVIKPKLNNWRKKPGMALRPRGLSEVSVFSDDSLGRGKEYDSGGEGKTNISTPSLVATIKTPLLPTTGEAKNSSGGRRKKKTRKKHKKRKKKKTRKRHCSKKRLKKKMICHKGTKRKLKKLRKLTKKLKVKLTKCSKKRLKKWKGGSLCKKTRRKRRGGNNEKAKEYWGKPIKERWRENPLLMVSPNAQRINWVYKTMKEGIPL